MEWLFHSMASTLLSLLLPQGDLTAVDTGRMGAGPVPSLLWNPSSRTPLCELGRLVRTVLVSATA